MYEMSLKGFKIEFINVVWPLNCVFWLSIFCRVSVGIVLVYGPWCPNQGQQESQQFMFIRRKIVKNISCVVIVLGPFQNGIIQQILLIRVARIRENRTDPDPDPFREIFTDPDPDPKRIRPISKNCHGNS